MSRPIKRCALYTRKSTEEGLDQEFNSLDAQREACAAYVKSQASEGWCTIDTAYDDGGFSGGSMERPAIKRLFADVALGKIDVVVVYKIDRLTRALADFARMVELFDRHDVSFVSVTQSFNTTSSMGRLTLNVLLSFAQFEREVTGERIRDKIAASKAKGMWMGGTVPLGYDVPLQNTRRLVVNEAEAETVRTIFAAYLELGSVHALESWLKERGVRSKKRLARNGRQYGGQVFSRGALFHLLRNRIYVGMIVHRGKAHQGLHEPIVEPDLFEAVQARLDTNVQRHVSKSNRAARAPLTGRIFDIDGQPMSPTFSYGRRGQLYRYYVSAPLQQGQKQQPDDTAIRRISAAALEEMLAGIMRRLNVANNSDVFFNLLRVEIYEDALHLMMPLRLLHGITRRLDDGEHVEADPLDASRLRLTLPIRMQLRGGRTWIAASADRAVTRPDRVLIKALRSAHAMVDLDASGMPVIKAAPDTAYHRRLVRLAFLAPDLQKAILAGRQPVDLTLARLMQKPAPLSWSSQMELFPMTN